MKSDFLIAITQLAAEKGLPKEVVLQAVEAALASAYKKDHGVANVVVKIDPTTGNISGYAEKTVTEQVSDPRLEITPEEARRYRANAQPGDTVEIPIVIHDAGRIAAQTAKQVVLQRLREAEREVVYEEFSDKEGDIVSGVVQRVEPRQVIIDLGRAEAVLPAAEQVRMEHYRPGQRLKAYLLEVYRSNKGPQLVVSRTHKNLLRRLFELEVPEIYKGIVEIKSIAREPGHRSKVAVAARQEGVDPVGSCVGMRGIRIQNIVNELNGERIDVIQWNADPARFVANALSPAQVLSVTVNEAENTATVIVPDRQLSLAIGKEGQNARLAAKLTGWRIDIKSQSMAQQEAAPVAVAAAPEEAVEVAAEAVDTAPPPAATPWPEEEAVEVAAEEPEEAPAPAAEEVPAVAPAEPPEAPAPAPAQIRFAEELLLPQRGRKDKRARGGKAIDEDLLEEERAKAKRPAKKARRLELDIDEYEDYEL